MLLYRYTPLHEAAAKGKFDICKFLLHHGADPTKKNRDGNSPADLVKEDDDDVADLLRGKNLLNRLSVGSLQAAVFRRRSSIGSGEERQFRKGEETADARECQLP